MGDIIQLFKNEPFQIADSNWSCLTKVNFEFMKRKLYIKQNGKLVMNPHLPIERLNRVNINFFAYYISLFVDIENRESIDCDFEIGFNNYEISFEKSIVGNFSKGNEMYIIVKSNILTSDLKSIFNVKSNEYLGKSHAIVYKDVEKVPTLVIANDENVDFNLLKDNIAGYLIGHKKNNNEIFNKKIELFDLETVARFVEEFDTVIYRVPFFANYNLMIFKENSCYDVIKKNVESSSKEFNLSFEEIDDIYCQENLLRYYLYRQ